VSRPSHSAITDFATFLLANLSVSWIVGYMLTLGLMTMFIEFLSPRIDFRLALSMSPIVHAILLLVLIDFLDYWIHRFSHENPALWQLHRYHHAAEEMTVLTVNRNHPIEVTIHSAIYALLGALFGSGAAELLAVVAARTVLAGLKHSAVQWDWGWFGKYVLQSPYLHWVHHSTDPAHHNSNYAALFSCWDVLFRTCVYPGKRIEEIGTGEHDLNSRYFVYDILRCYLLCLRELLPTRLVSRVQARFAAPVTNP
jgi:sterol desaturase/sphingolipid hydroxylase (fatty acid hydroxylase superfamily)